MDGANLNDAPDPRRIEDVEFILGKDRADLMRELQAMLKKKELEQRFQEAIEFNPPDPLLGLLQRAGLI